MTKKTAKKHDNYWRDRAEDIMRYIDSTDIDVFEELQKYTSSIAQKFNVIYLRL